MSEAAFSNQRIGGANPLFLIAEAGVNHNGKKDMAFRLVDAAARCGVDAIKFQTYQTEELVWRDAPSAGHHKANIREGLSHYELLKKLELPQEFYAELKAYCEKKSLIFISSPYDIPSARLLDSIGTEIIKIPSAEITMIPMLEVIAEFHRPVFLSTGMSSIQEVQKAVQIFEDGSCPLGILKCTSNYPASPESVHLRGLETLRMEFPNHVIGFSDHCRGNAISFAALGMGIKILERHFTLDRSLWGPDHAASLIPSEMKALADGVRNIEKAFGKNKIEMQNEEKQQRTTMRKSIFSRTFITKGQSITLEQMKFLRPGTGLPPEAYKNLIAKKALHDIVADELLRYEDFESSE